MTNKWRLRRGGIITVNLIIAVHAVSGLTDDGPTGWTTDIVSFYTNIQPLVQPVGQPQRVVLYARGF